MASPSQIHGSGKVPPRVIEGSAVGDKSARPPALAAAAFVSAAALIALAANAADTVTSQSGRAPEGGVVAAAIVSVVPLVVVAVGAVVSLLRSPAFAGALTAGYGSVALGLTVLDVGLMLDPIDANRLELFRPVTAAALEPGVGAYLVLAAHALAVVGGVSGWIAVGRASLDDGYGESASPDLTGRASAARIGALLSVSVVAAAVVGAGALFVPPFASTDSIVLVPAVIASPWTTAVGSALVALAVLVVAAAALASISPVVASGALLGAGAALFGILGSRVVAGLSSGPGIEVSPGSVVGAVAAVVLLVAGGAALPAAAARDRRATADRIRRPGLGDGQASTTRWHVVAGAAGVVSGVASIAGGLLPVLVVPDGLPSPTILATRTAVIAGFVLVVASVPLFFSLFAATARPALGVLSVAVVMTSAGVLQSVVLATDITGIEVGTGGIAILVAVVAAVVCGAATLSAGSAERDDVDTSEVTADRVVGSVALSGAVVAAIGLALPLYRGADVTAASVTELPWGWDVWGQLALAVTVVIAAVVASRARPTRGAALLAGGSVAMIVYVTGWPLTSARATDPSVGPGVVAGSLAVVILGVAAVLSARRRTQ
ncbi:hypothetical protein [Rhodococcoides kyotonense]|uniref:Uncharacterized protein n=1 Tax=Rhodococcoides kyotonense TaxID=398843 RepID=A0A239EJP0_9NOCA|nr:hypothetical protein [Rhodococcus kyotonensis]SNS44084.1 hypothetical protein SAMN05421642_102389 [Rhodococcus kyotonensis]